jgi:hypothetical protein
MESRQRMESRRGFLRVLGGAALALVGSVGGVAADWRDAGRRRIDGRAPAAVRSGPAGRATMTGHPLGGPARKDTKHPDPRPDVDGSNVLTAADLSGNPDLIPLFEGIAKIPQIADGIGCACGCASDPNIRSLLTCFEKSSRMALFCEICQAEGRMAVRLHDNGRTLDQIRAALDARFG